MHWKWQPKTQPLWKPTPPRQVAAYQADRYVIAAKTANYFTKLFQVSFGSDGSIFVTLPYYRDVPGRLGVLHIPGGMTFPATMQFGENCPITSHAVKYSHHPSGRAHFSLTGKVKSDIGKQSVKLHQANGHLFTVMVQGMAHFEAVAQTEQATKKRGIVPFGIDQPDPEAIKFIAHLFSRTECGRRYHGQSKNPWNLAISPDGKHRLGILLATPYKHRNEPYFLQLSLERIPRISKDDDLFLSLIGGFDESSRALDHSQDTSCLICLYPQTGDLQELLQKFGTVDITSK